MVMIATPRSARRRERGRAAVLMSVAFGAAALNMFRGSADSGMVIRTPRRCFTSCPDRTSKGPTMFDRARARRTWITAFALVLLAGCDEGARPSTQEPLPPRETATSASTSAPASAPTLASASSSAAAPAQPAMAGSWEGRYDAKKAEIALPPKVKDKSWGKDDGKLASGAGTIKLEISPAGDISGRGSGALGDVTLTGKVEDTMVRASVMPVDRAASPSMSGVLVGLIKGDAIQATIKVAGPDATIVRESAIELRRK